MARHGLLRLDSRGALNPEPEPASAPPHAVPVRRSHRLRGDPPPALTARQCEVLMHLAHGDMYEEIAEQIGCSPETIRNHATMTRARLNARNTAHAVAIALTNGWITLTPPEL